MKTDNTKDKPKTREEELKEIEKNFTKGFLKDLKPPRENK